MAFFKFRNAAAAQEASIFGARRSTKKNSAAAAESVDALRRRARHRLMGTALLVLLAVLLFPLVFDTQPRPVALDLPIVVAERNESTPVAVPAAPASAPTAPPATDSLAANNSPSTASSSAAQAEVPKSSDPAAQAQAQADQQAEAQQQARAAQAAKAKAEHEAQARAEQQAQQAAARKQAQELARARTLLGISNAAQPAQTSAPAASGGRFVVQIGAYAENAGVRVARNKAQQAGVATFTQEVHTHDGLRIRVRAGPFSTRDAADQAAAKLHQAGLGAAVLPL